MYQLSQLQSKRDTVVKAVSKSSLFSKLNSSPMKKFQNTVVLVYSCSLRLHFRPQGCKQRRERKLQSGNYTMPRFGQARY